MPTPAETLAKIAENPLLAPDPALRDWPVPPGVRATEEGLRTTFRAMRFAFASLTREGGEIEFAATRRPSTVAGIVAAGLAGVTAWAMSVAGAPLSWMVTAVVLEALIVALAISPRYAVRGQVRDGRLSFRVEAKGLLGRASRVERELRFYLGA